MAFLEHAEDVDGGDILAPRGDDRTMRAVEFLREALSDGEWHESVGLKKLAGATGISDRTLQRAAQSMNVEDERRGFPSVTWWRIALVGASVIPVAPPPVAPRHAATNGATTEPSIPSGFLDPETPVAPLAPTRQGDSKPIVALGDDLYLDLLDRALAGGLITERERRGRRRIHFAVRAVLAA
jgi:hypothetical protein